MVTTSILKDLIWCRKQTNKHRDAFLWADNMFSTICRVYSNVMTIDEVSVLLTRHPDGLLDKQRLSLQIYMYTCGGLYYAKDIA